jgi:hypothetical protein
MFTAGYWRGCDHFFLTTSSSFLSVCLSLCLPAPNQHHLSPFYPSVVYEVSCIFKIPLTVRRAVFCNTIISNTDAGLEFREGPVGVPRSSARAIVRLPILVEFSALGQAYSSPHGARETQNIVCVREASVGCRTGAEVGG